MNTRDITLAVSAGIIGAVITLLADHSLVSTQANAAILMLPNAANPTVVEQISVLDDHLWGFHVDGDRIRTCTSSTNSRTLTAPRCSDWTG